MTNIRLVFVALLGTLGVEASSPWIKPCVVVARGWKGGGGEELKVKGEGDLW